jgi:hypothetical protein
MKAALSVKEDQNELFQVTKNHHTLDQQQSFAENQNKLSERIRISLAFVSDAVSRVAIWQLSIVRMLLLAYT